MHWSNLPDNYNYPGMNELPVNRYIKPESNRSSYSRFPPIKQYNYKSSTPDSRKKPKKNNGMLGSSLMPMMIAMQNFRQKPKQQDEFAFEVQRIMEHQETMLKKLQREKMGNGPDQMLLRKLNQLERKIEEAT